MASSSIKSFIIRLNKSLFKKSISISGSLRGPNFGLQTVLMDLSPAVNTPICSLLCLFHLVCLYCCFFSKIGSKNGLFCVQ